MSFDYGLGTMTATTWLWVGMVVMGFAHHVTEANIWPKYD